MIKRYVQNERGNTLLVIVGLLVGAVFLSFIFLDFFTTFATKRVSQNSADAAVLGAANEIQRIYDAKLISEIEIRMDRLREVANDFVDEEIEELREAWEEANEDVDEEDRVPFQITPQQLDSIWNRVLSRMQVPNRLRPPVRYPHLEVDANVALVYFFENVWYRSWFSREIEEINEVVCREIRNTQSQWKDAAIYYATKNGAEDDIDLIFKGDEFKVMARVKKPASFFVTNDSDFAQGERDVYAEAEATIKQPRNIDIRCR